MLLCLVGLLAGYGFAAGPLHADARKDIPRAQLVGPDDISKHFYETVPTLTFSLTGLTQYSTTFLRIYYGSNVPESEEGVIAKESIVMVTGAGGARTQKLALDDLNRLFWREGVHTMEIVHQTPARTRVLHRSVIKVDRTTGGPGTLDPEERHKRFPWLRSTPPEGSKPGWRIL